MTVQGLPSVTSWSLCTCFKSDGTCPLLSFTQRLKAMGHSQRKRAGKLRVKTGTALGPQDVLGYRRLLLAVLQEQAQLWGPLNPLLRWLRDPRHLLPHTGHLC